MQWEGGGVCVEHAETTATGEPAQAIEGASNGTCHHYRVLSVHTKPLVQ